MATDRLAELSGTAAPLIEMGDNDVELPTRSGSPRWGLSANLRRDAVGPAGGTVVVTLGLTSRT